MLTAMLTGQLVHVPPVPPAWRATQLAELGGHVQGAPPCLSSLTKVGRRTVRVRVRVRDTVTVTVTFTVRVAVQL